MANSGQSLHSHGTTAQQTMRAVLHERYGTSEVLHSGRTARPGIPADGVLVRVHAAGLDRGVVHAVTGLPYLGRVSFGLTGPKVRVPGFDLAGTVEAVGARVTGFEVGEEVYGFGKGAFAEYAVVPARRLARKPANLTFEQAAVVPVSAVTALQALDRGRLQPDQKVLVTGASGGVGSYAVQLAKALGAEVTGVASTAKLDHVRGLGADHVIDYGHEDFADGSRHWDLIVDIAGNPTISRLRRALSPSGTAVITGGEKGGSFSGGMNRHLRAVALSPFLRQRLTMFVSSVEAADLDRITAMIEAGQLTPGLDRTFPLHRVPEAVDYLVSGQVRGKVAITV